MSDWTKADLAELALAGVALPSQRAGDRSEHAFERVLQAACAGAVTMTETLFEVLVEVDGVAATDAETRAVVDLMASDHLVWIGRRLTCTAHGREQLNRWSKYKPLRCLRGC